MSILSLTTLSSAIEKNVKVYNVYSLYLKIVECTYSEGLRENIDYIASKTLENLPA
jgi:hypothetical protein